MDSTNLEQYAEYNINKSFNIISAYMLELMEFEPIQNLTINGVSTRYLIEVQYNYLIEYMGIEGIEIDNDVVISGINLNEDYASLMYFINVIKSSNKHDYICQLFDDIKNNYSMLAQFLYEE